MKEVIIKYSDSKTLELLKNLAGYLGFSISEKQDVSGQERKRASFDALKIDTRGYKFNRDIANER